MKKFLTVLLVIAVMFTFSFSSAFAYTAGPAFTEDTFNQATADGWFTTLWDAYLKATNTDADAPSHSYTDGTKSYVVENTTLAGYEATAKKAYNLYLQKDSVKHYVVELDEFNKAVLETSTSQGIDFAAEIVAAQFALDKAAALAKYEISTVGYSKEESTMKIAAKEVSYQAAADALIAEAKAAIEDEDEFNADATISSYAIALENINKVLEGTTKSEKVFDKDGNALSLGLVEVMYKVGSESYTTGTYDLEAAYKAADVSAHKVTDATNQWSEKTISGVNALDDANKAALKAQVAYVYASTKTTNDSQKEGLDAWKAIMELAIDNGLVATQGDIRPAVIDDTYVKAADAVSDLDAYAAKALTKKDAAGNAILDAKDVADTVKTAKKNIATEALKSPIDEAKVAEIYKNATTAIDAASTTLYKELVEWGKAYYKNEAKEMLDSATKEETYYPTELAKVQALYDEFVAAIDATDMENYANVLTTFNTKLGKIDDVKEVNKALLTGDLKTGFGAVKTGLVQYVQYYQLTKADDADAQLDASKLEARLLEFVGNTEARTNAEIKALANDAMAVATGLPTVADVKAAAKAEKEAVNAIPATVVVDSADVIKAAMDASKAYQNLTTKTDAYTTKINTARKELSAAYAKAFAPKMNAIDKTDEAAVRALLSEINDVLSAKVVLEPVVLNDFVKTLNKYLFEIQTKEAKAVATAINAIPYSVNEKDEAVVKAARAAYDAYVTKWTDYKHDDFGFAAGHFTNLASYGLKSPVNTCNYDELVAAESVLGLNAEPEYAAVEALKITAKSVAKKGYIKVSWTVKGDAAKADGYQVYRSTKANKGYKKAFTTAKKTYKNTKVTKGTRYYYKVRAYKTVDGVKYYSDWSNKAYRVAK